jgi:hypothetical protein
MLKCQNNESDEQMREWIDHVINMINSKHRHWPMINPESELFEQYRLLDIASVKLSVNTRKFLNAVSPRPLVLKIESLALSIRQYVIPSGDNELTLGLIDDVKAHIEILADISVMVEDMTAFLMDTHDDNCSIKKRYNKISAGSETTESFNVDYDTLLFKCWDNGACETRRQYIAYESKILAGIKVAEESFAELLKRKH